MQDAVLIYATLAVFALGYFVVRRLDAFLSENQQAVEEESRKNSTLVRIAAETPPILRAVVSAMEVCSWTKPYLAFSVSSGSANGMLRQLQDGTIDLALLTEATAGEFPPRFSSIRIPYPAGQAVNRCWEPKEGATILVLWNQAIPSPDRDRVVSFLCNGF